MVIFAEASAAELAVRSSIESLGRLFAIVMALAIGEAFKQFVSDKADKPDDRQIHWDRLLALLAFSMLVVPFSHGMARYFFDTYQETKRPRPYSVYLFLDTITFTVEAILFFILSRALPRVQWRRFYWTVAALLLLDIIWGIFTACSHEPQLWNWVIINLITTPVLALVIFFNRRSTSWCPVFFCLGIVTARTVADYYFDWPYYFPPQPEARGQVSMGGGQMEFKHKVYLAGPGVFLRGSDAYGQEKVAICRQHGLDAHYPTDNQLSIKELIKTKGLRGTALEISINDEKGMDGCNTVIADLTPCFSGLPDLRVLVKGDQWDQAALLKHCPGLKDAFAQYPGLAALMIDFPEAGQLLTGQPDTGTVFELGYMVAKAKATRQEESLNTFAYSNSPIDYYTRLLIANGGDLPKRPEGNAANFVQEDINQMMVDRLDPTMHSNLMIDSPVIRFSGKEVERPTIAETRQFLEEGRRQQRRDGMYTYLGGFRQCVQHAANVLRRQH